MLYLCPKYVTNKTPQPYRQWLEAIDDSLDEEVDESRYDSSIIQDIFTLIERDDISPQEMARMKEEYNLEEDKQARYQLGRKEGLKESQLAIAKTMLEKGLEPNIIYEITGVNLEEI